MAELAAPRHVTAVAAIIALAIIALNVKLLLDAVTG
jgi:Mn2+/Fe2+ NRAMP family transporter